MVSIPSQIAVSYSVVRWHILLATYRTSLRDEAVQRLLQALPLYLRGAVGSRAVQAAFQVVFENHPRYPINRRPDGGQLHEHVWARTALFHHTLHCPQMTGGAGQAVEYRLGLLVWRVIFVCVRVLPVRLDVGVFRWIRWLAPGRRSSSRASSVSVLVCPAHGLFLSGASPRPIARGW